MHRLRKRPKLKKIVAWMLLILGVAGIILPILPGAIFLGLGFYLLSLDAPHIQEKIHTYRTRHKTLDHILKRSYDRLHAQHKP